MDLKTACLSWKMMRLGLNKSKTVSQHWSIQSIWIFTDSNLEQSLIWSFHFLKWETSLRTCRLKLSHAIKWHLFIEWSINILLSMFHSKKKKLGAQTMLISSINCIWQSLKDTLGFMTQDWLKGLFKYFWRITHLSTFSVQAINWNFWKVLMS